MCKLNELLTQLCPCGIKYSPLSNVCKSLPKGTLKTGDLNQNGKYPVINSGKDFYGRYQEYNNEGNVFTLAARGEYAGFVTYIEHRFWAGGLCYPYRSKNEDELLTKFVYYFLKQQENTIMSTLVARGSIPALNKADIDKIMIPLPPLPVQQEIVRILDNFTELTAELNKSLEEEVSARRKQYEHYRDELLTFGDEVPKMPIAQCTERTKNIKWKENTAEYRYIDLTSVNLKNHQIESTTLISASDAPSRAQQLVKENDILFGTTRPMLQRQCLVPQCYDGQICSTGFCVLRTKIGVLLPEMLYYLMQTKAFYTYVERNQKGASYPSISDADVKRFEIPIVSIPEQKSIVTLLKHFDVLCNDLTSGLPAEITARQKQYEYYRDKLLTFKELEG